MASKSTASAYSSHRTAPTSAAAAAALAVLGQRHGSALDLTAFDPPSQINETAPYMYHRRNSSYSSDADASQDGTATDRGAPVGAKEVRLPATTPIMPTVVIQKTPLSLSPSPTSARGAAGGRGERVAASRPAHEAPAARPQPVPVSPRSGLHSAYSNTSWLSAATPSSCYRSGLLDEDENAAHTVDEAWPRPLSGGDPSDALLASLTVQRPRPLPVAPLGGREDEASFELASIAPAAMVPVMRPALPLSTASESVNALEAQFGAALQQIEAYQRMHRKLESHNARLESELAQRTDELAEMRRACAGPVRQTLTRLRAECTGLSAYVQLALRDYHYSMQQTEKAIGQLLSGAAQRAMRGVPVSSESAFPQSAAALPSVSRASLRSSPVPSHGPSSSAAPYRPGEWMSGISMYAKGTPTSRQTPRHSMANDTEEAPEEEEEEEEEEEVAMMRLLEAAPRPSLTVSRSSSPAPPLPPPSANLAVAQRSLLSTSMVDGDDTAHYCDAPDEADQEEEDYAEGEDEAVSPRAPVVVSLSDYRALQLKLAASQRQLLLAEGKYRVLRQDTDARLTTLQEVHTARVETLETEVNTLRARLSSAEPVSRGQGWSRTLTGADASRAAPASVTSSSVGVVRAPERCYQYSTLSSAAPSHASRHGAADRPHVDRRDTGRNHDDDDADEEREEEEEGEEEDEDEEDESYTPSMTTTTTDGAARAPVPRRCTVPVVSHPPPRPVVDKHASRRRPSAVSTSQPDGLNESDRSHASSASERSPHHHHTHHSHNRALSGAVAGDTYGAARISREMEAMLGDGGAERVAQGLWAEQLLARRRREKQLYTY